MNETKQKEIREKWLKSSGITSVDFILQELSTLLSEDRAKTVDIIRKCKRKYDFQTAEEMFGYKNACDDILNLLNNRE